MSALDHAAVEVPGVAVAPRRRHLPGVTPARAAIAFAVAQIPLALIAIAAEWRGTYEAPEHAGPIVKDVLVFGSQISGPLMPQLIFVALAFLATRSSRRISTLGTAGIGVMGVLVTYNGAMAGLTEPEHAPQAAAIAAGIGFTAAGVALVVLSVRSLIQRRER
jgi:hypothetical protein